MCACETSPRDHLSEAREALNAAAYDDAVAAAEAGLASDPDATTAWGLELLLLESHARSGHAEATKTQLAKLVDTHRQRIPPSEYAATAHQLKQAGQGAAAIEVLDMGVARFPNDRLINQMIGVASSGDGDPAELEMLRSLGYIE
jgi:hypothetical protein